MSATVEGPYYRSPRTMGRFIAVLVLVTIVLGIIAQVLISERLVSLRDPARTATNILANISLYRTGFTLYMIEMAAQIGSTVLLYHLLKPANARIATVALAFGLVGCTIKIFSRVFYLAPLFLLDQREFGALGAEQVQALSLVLLNVNDRGAGVALGFFGVETVLEGCLMMRSTFLPRWLGALVMIGGFGWLAFLSPTLGYELFNVVALVALVTVIVLVGWLLVKGVDEQRWYAMAALRDYHTGR